MKPLPAPNPRDPQFQAGVRFAVTFLEGLAKDAVGISEGVRRLCLTDAAERLERARPVGAPSYAGTEIRPRAGAPDQPDPLNLVVDFDPKICPPQ